MLDKFSAIELYFNNTTTVNSKEELFEILSNYNCEDYTEILLSGECNAVVFNDVIFLNINTPNKKLQGAYDPYWDIILFNMNKLKDFETFIPIFNHEMQHLKDFHQLMKRYSFDDAITVFQDAIYETNAFTAQLGL